MNKSNFMYNHLIFELACMLCKKSGTFFEINKTVIKSKDINFIIANEDLN